MNTLTIQKKLVDFAEKRRCLKKCPRYRYFETNDNVYIVEDSRIIVIPKKQFYLDIEKVFDEPPVTAVKPLLERHYKEAVLTNELTNVDGNICNVFECSNGETVLIDTKLLKEFDLDHCTFESCGKFAPLHIFENDVLVGIVLPIKFKGGML